MPSAPGAAHAATCYALHEEYLVYGCPFVSSAAGAWNDKHCVAMRQQMAASRCPVPSGHLSGLLGDASSSTWLVGSLALGLGLVGWAAWAVTRPAKRRSLSGARRRRRR